MTVAQRIRLHLFLRSVRWTLFVGGTAAVAVFVVGAVVAVAVSSPPQSP